jgi:DNA polymerase-1
LYRAYYAFIKNPLINSKGQNTSAIYGVANSFLHFLDTHNPEHIIVSFDRKGPTFRHEMSEAYKANRPPMPDDLISQVEPVKEFFAAITLPEISAEGYEADDVLATLASHFKKEYDVVIVTGDKDYSQLVDEQVKLYDPMKDADIDREAVITKFGVTPEQFIDYLALVGDASDNIPGVKGIGPKTAVDLLNSYETLDGIYANLDSIKGKVQEKLITDKESAYLSQELAKIILDVPIQMPDLERISFDRRDLIKSLPLLTEYEVTSIKRRIESIGKHLGAELQVRPPEPEPIQEDLFSSMDTGSQQENTPMPVDRAFEAVLTDQHTWQELISHLKAAQIVSIDCETDSINPMQANLVGISICYEEHRSWYLPLAHQMADNLDLQSVLAELGKALSGKTLLGHNLKYDLIVFDRHGMKLENAIFDTMLAAYILDPGVNQYSLDECALQELGYTMKPIKDLIGSGKNQITFDLVDVNEACFYAAEDAWAVFILFPIYRRKLDKLGLRVIFDNIEIPLVPVLQSMEQSGVFINESVLGSISKQIHHELKTLTDLIYKVAGYQFNINSTQQLAKLLFEELKLPSKKKTKTGFSTDNSVLEELADEYEIAAFISQYRMLAKLDSTYVSALPRMQNPHTGRIHSSFNQTIASTGRLSSSNPNLQNIPIRTELGRQIRKAFISESEEWCIVSADYSQIELRLLALMSEDEVLLRAFKLGADIHRQMAASISGKEPEQVSSDERRAAKTINFGILYGMGQVKLSRELGITQAEAKEIIKNYFDRFPGIRAFLDRCVALARQNQYCETIFGRRLYLPYINSSNNRLKSEAERIAVNMPIQGTAADLIKIAMINIYKRIKDRDQSIRMILQVHDELVFEVRKDVLDEARELIISEMEAALPEKYRDQIELKAELGYGRSWYDAH